MVSSFGQRRLYSDWVDAQADLSLRWTHSHFGGFVLSWLISWFYVTRLFLWYRSRLFNFLRSLVAAHPGDMFSFRFLCSIIPVKPSLFSFVDHISGVDFTKGFKTWHKFSTEIRFMLIPIIVLFIAHEFITGSFDKTGKHRAMTEHSTKIYL